jgi:hypothetical protein
MCQRRGMLILQVVLGGKGFAEILKQMFFHKTIGVKKLLTALQNLIY